MSNKLLEQIEKKIYWGIVGFILTLAFGFIGLYTYYHEKKPNLLFEIINESNVLDVHKELDNLTIYFDNEDIRKKNLNLRIITVQISNNGEIDILQSHYDQKIEWGFKVSNGKIINDARIVNSNSDYLKNHLSPKIISGNTVNLEKVIFEKGKFFSIEVLVIHNKDTQPAINYIGKIVGIETVTPIKTWEKNLVPSFWEKFFYGGLLINVLRPIVTFIAFLAIGIFLGFILDATFNSRRQKKKKSREKRIYKLLGGEPKDDKINVMTKIYSEDGLEGLERIEKHFKNLPILKLEVDKYIIEKGYREKKQAIEKTMEKLEGSSEGYDQFSRGTHFPQ